MKNQNTVAAFSEHLYFQEISRTVMIILTCRNVYAEKLHSAYFMQYLTDILGQSLQGRVFPSGSHSTVGTGS